MTEQKEKHYIRRTSISYLVGQAIRCARERYETHAVMLKLTNRNKDRKGVL